MTWGELVDGAAHVPGAGEACQASYRLDVVDLRARLEHGYRVHRPNVPQITDGGRLRTLEDAYQVRGRDVEGFGDGVECERRIACVRSDEGRRALEERSPRDGTATVSRQAGLLDENRRGHRLQRSLDLHEARTRRGYLRVQHRHHEGDERITQASAGHEGLSFDPGDVEEPGQTRPIDLDLDDGGRSTRPHDVTASRPHPRRPHLQGNDTVLRLRAEVAVQKECQRHDFLAVGEAPVGGESGRPHPSQHKGPTGDLVGEKVQRTQMRTHSIATLSQPSFGVVVNEVDVFFGGRLNHGPLLPRILAGPWSEQKPTRSERTYPAEASENPTGQLSALRLPLPRNVLASHTVTFWLTRSQKMIVSRP
ncbi:hypothetical protein ABE10_12495 [Bacillus toyonensis]|nr:hypothetical protein [Bacillus toyonensis]